MDVMKILDDCVEFLGVIGKSKYITIHSYDSELGLLILRNTRGRKMSLKANKNSNSIDIGIYIRPYKNDSVEVLHPYKKQVKEGVTGLITIIDEVFIHLNKIYSELDK